MPAGLRVIVKLLARKAARLLGRHAAQAGACHGMSAEHLADREVAARLLAAPPYQSHRALDVALSKGTALTFLHFKFAQ